MGSWEKKNWCFTLKNSVKPKQESSVDYRLNDCNYWQYFLKLKESLYIMKNESSLNRNIQSALIISQIPLIWLLSLSLYSKSVIFPSTFYCRDSVVKIQSSIEFQNSIFHLFHFNSPYFTDNFEVLLLIHYLLEKQFKEGYIFSAFYSGSAFCSNLAGFKSQIYSLS